MLKNCRGARLVFNVSVNDNASEGGVVFWPLFTRHGFAPRVVLRAKGTEGAEPRHRPADLSGGQSELERTEPIAMHECRTLERVLRGSCQEGQIGSLRL